jgi:hypothetical protein
LLMKNCDFFHGFLQPWGILRDPKSPHGLKDPMDLGVPPGTTVSGNFRTWEATIKKAMKYWSGWWFGTWLLWLSVYWECHHPNWLIFFRGVGQPPTIFFLWVYDISFHQQWPCWVHGRWVQY